MNITEGGGVCHVERVRGGAGAGDPEEGGGV